MDFQDGKSDPKFVNDFERSRRFRPSVLGLVLAGLVVALVGVGGAIWWWSRQRVPEGPADPSVPEAVAVAVAAKESAAGGSEMETPPPLEPPSPSPPAAAPVPSASAGASLTGEFSIPEAKEPQSESITLDEAREAIRAFFAARTWQERLPAIYGAGILREEIEAYYASHPDGPVEDVHLKFLLTDPDPKDGDYPLAVFFANAKPVGWDEDIPVTVRKLPDGLKVDWEAFIEFKDREFGRYLESGEPDPRVFRIILERQSYWGADRQDMADHLSYQVESADPDDATTAFVKKGSPIAATLEKYFSWGAGPIATTVELSRQEMPHGETHLMIGRLVTDPEAADGWHIRPGEVLRAD